MQADREADYEILERYLETAFVLLEGAHSVEEARSHLRDYLEWHRRNNLGPELESFLIELFFARCRRS